MLACLSAAASGAGFGPLTAEIALPEAARGKPVWAATPLASGELAVGFEGSVAIGYPHGRWQIVATPRGEVARAISEAHGRVLVAGMGFCGFLQDGQIVALAALGGEYVSAEPIPTGWLVAGRDGLWSIDVSGTCARLGPPSAPGTQARVFRWNGNVLVSPGTPPVQIWRQGALVSGPEVKALEDAKIHQLDGNLFATNMGFIRADGELVLPSSTSRAAIRAGLVGIAEVGPWAIVATFTEGLAAIDKLTQDVAWTWQPKGGVYFLQRHQDGFFVGTGTGLYFMPDPAKSQGMQRTVTAALAIKAAPGHEVQFADGDGVVTVGLSTETRSSQQWPTIGGASVDAERLRFGQASALLPQRFINGLAVCGDVAAVSFETGLLLLSADGRRIDVSLPGIARSLASDGRQFLVGTSTSGAHVLAIDGRIVGQIGTGRTEVVELRPGKVVVLCWTGEIYDSDGALLGQVHSGNPTAAVLAGDRMAVLVTRADRGPVLLALDGNAWRPLEVPGLHDVAAQQLAASDQWLFAAGSRGLMRIRLPLPSASAPAVPWTWSGVRTGAEVRLASSSTDYAELIAPVLDLPPLAPTLLRVRNAHGITTELTAGNPLPLPVTWGRTPVTLIAERNGLVVEETMVVFRPWPWWLRWWVWPFHVAAMGGLIVGLARLRTRRLDRRNRELELRVAERTEQLHKANAAKEEFLAGISHEIRNPLNGVVGICAILSERNVGQHEKTLVRTLGGCADQLRSMLDDILDFSRIERGALTVTNSDFEVSSLVEEAARVMDPELAACALIVPDQPVWLHGDSGKLRQLVCNLVSNALKYGVPREAGIEARLESAGAGRSRLRIAVRNSGPTIPADEIPRLFNSFQRGARTTNIPGSGLGLAVCRRLVQAIGGRITAASVEGVTEFAIEVVLANAQPPAPVAATPTAVSRALAIEDEDYNRVALGHVLHALGYRVDWAVDGASALRLAAENQYDLVLTDWRLPDMEGGDLCKRLLALLPEPKPPVVAVTAYSTREKLEEARLAGMTGFVTKPVTKEKLERVIRGVGEALRPKRSLDTETHVEPSPFASLGDLAPSVEQLSADIAAKWRNVYTMARLGDPRSGREAHALLSLLRLAAEETAAEQIEIIEHAAADGDWDTVTKTLPFASEEIMAAQSRLRT